MGDARRRRALRGDAPLLKLDFGCGPNPIAGFDGVDQYSFDGKVKHVLDLRKRTASGTFHPWPWPDCSVAEAHASHFVEHLTARERIHFVNELYRVLIPNGTCKVVVPHWASCRAYGDPTHQWPPISEFWFYYLSRKWRLGDPAATPPVGANAPHTDVSLTTDGFDCDFESTWGYSLRADLATRNQEYQQFAMSNYKEVLLDTIATLKKV